MTRDYRKAPARKPGTRGSMRIFPAVALAFVTGYITANVFDAESLGHWLEQSVAKWRGSTTKQAEHTQASAHQAALPKPKFEFYTLLAQEQPRPGTPQHLPKTQVLPSAEAYELAKAIQKQTQIQEATPLAPLHKTAKRQQYEIQLASYHKKEEAQRLQAHLLLQDYEVHIQEFHRDNSHWFRVMIGPYSSRRAAEKAQLSLAHSEHIMGIIRRQEV
ncbi:MAG: SPOR domain-containing protein [Legionellaceae bacterium]|nr:SPOR domain-containing protein [Legionellaceae bacterium]